MHKDNKKPTDNSKIDKNKNAKIANKKPLSEKFNLKAIKRKAVIGSLVATFGTITVGGVAITKYSYDQTERVVQFQLKSVSDKKTIVEENCSYKKIASYTSWDSGFFSFFDDNDFENVTVSEGKKKCDIEILDRLVNTSGGVLQNNSSLLDMKDEADVEVIDKNLKPGYWYEATVKGFEALGGNNIITVRRLPDDWKQATENLSRIAKPATALAIPTPNADRPKSASSDSDIEALQRQLEILKIQQQLDDMKRKQQQGSEQVIKPMAPAPKPPA